MFIISLSIYLLSILFIIAYPISLAHMSGIMDRKSAEVSLKFTRLSLVKTSVECYNITIKIVTLQNLIQIVFCNKTKHFYFQLILLHGKSVKIKVSLMNTFDAITIT